jgi:hypothetical protein
VVATAWHGDICAKRLKLAGHDATEKPGSTRNDDPAAIPERRHAEKPVMCAMLRRGKA